MRRDSKRSQPASTQKTGNSIIHYSHDICTSALLIFKCIHIYAYNMLNDAPHVMWCRVVGVTEDSAGNVFNFADGQTPSSTEETEIMDSTLS